VLALTRTGERIRDKIAASKRKGMWMGGPVPLGYDVESRKLVMNEAEAGPVRHIMERYLALGSVVELADELNRQGHRTKVQHRASGPHRGGSIFRRGTLYHLLSNSIYIGDIVHKGEHYAGEHSAIVSAELWAAVQAKLAANTSGPSRCLRSQQPCLLVGRIFDGEGRAMMPSHATKSGRRYCYYVMRPDQLEGSPAWRASAHDIEQLVCQRLEQLLLDQQFVSRLVGDQSAEALQRALREGDLAATTLRSGGAAGKFGILEMLSPRITLQDDGIDLAVRPQIWQISCA
jgi:hypothetical protein